MFAFVFVLMVSKVAAEGFVCTQITDGFSVTELFLKIESDAGSDDFTDISCFNSDIVGTFPNDLTDFPALDSWLAKKCHHGNTSRRIC